MDALEHTSKNSIYYIFKPLIAGTTTRLVLKKPKTDSSIRKIWLPKTVAYLLRDLKKQQEEYKELLGDEYEDFNLVVAQPNGRPTEKRLIERRFSELKKKTGLPDVVFHSLRHSSTTYKLKLNNGDLKATQGDTGHAQINMITDIYSHILDEDRKVNAQKFEKEFYSPKKEENKTPDIDTDMLIEKLRNSPDLMQKLAALLAAENPAVSKT